MDLNLSDYDYQLIIGSVTPIDVEAKLTTKITRYQKYRRFQKIDITDAIVTNYFFMDQVTNAMWAKLVLAFEHKLENSNKYIQIDGALYDRRKIDILLARK